MRYSKIQGGKVKTIANPRVILILYKMYYWDQGGGGVLELKRDFSLIDIILVELMQKSFFKVLIRRSHFCPNYFRVEFQL